MVKSFLPLLGGLIVGLSQLSAQVVQLPTFNQFTVNTTVSVPDGGGTSLARVPTGRWQRSTRSIPALGRLPGVGPVVQQRFLRRGSSLSQAQVRATIIDLRAWDEAILASAARGGVPAAALPRDEVEQRARFLTQHIGRSGLSPHLKADARRDSSAMSR